MVHAGRAWRGWFPVGGELTSGRPDRKEGIYFGAEHPADHPRVVTGAALHGANLSPSRPADLGALGRRAGSTRWSECRDAVDRRHRAGARSRRADGSPSISTYDADRCCSASSTTRRTVRTDATTRSDDWGVAEHTDYGLLTVLAQDELGGLEVARARRWLDRRRSDARHVRLQPRRHARAADERPLPIDAASGAEHVDAGPAVVPLLLRSVVGCHGARAPARRRHDRRTSEPAGTAPTSRRGTARYGDYLTAKVAKVFPELFAAT